MLGIENTDEFYQPGWDKYCPNVVLILIASANCLNYKLYPIQGRRVSRSGKIGQVARLQSKHHQDLLPGPTFQRK
jgi:hypothetical protein